MANSLKVVNSTTNEVQLNIDQGTDFAQTLQFFTDTTNTTPRNILNHIFRAKARYLTHKNDNDVVTFTNVITDAPNGVLSFRLSNTQTAAMKSGNWVYDLEMETPAGNVEKIIWGTLVISPEATYE